MRGSGSRSWPSLSEQAVELVERAEGDRDLALLALRVPLSCTRISTVAVNASESCRSRRKNVARLLTFRAQQRRLPRAAGCAPGDQLLGLAHAQLLGDDLVGRQDLLCAVERQQRPRMAHVDGRRRSASAAPARSVAAGAAGCWRRCASGRRRAPPARASGRTPRSGACRPCASSSGFRSSRWMFSISAIAAAASSGTSCTSTGTSSRPARRAARTRRSPAMISKRSPAPPSMRRTSTGCITPCALMLSASSYRAGLRPCACAAGSGRPAAARAASVRGSPSLAAAPARALLEPSGRAALRGRARGPWVSSSPWADCP